MKGTLTIDMFRCIPEIDFTSGYRYFLGNLDNYSQALMSTLKSIRAKLPILNSMLHTNEYEGLRTITQTLRRFFSNIGATELSEQSYQLELVLLNEEAEVLQEELIFYISSLYEMLDHLELLLKNMNETDTDSNQEKEVSFKNYDFSKTKESIKLSTNLLKRKII